MHKVKIKKCIDICLVYSLSKYLLPGMTYIYEKFLLKWLGRIKYIYYGSEDDDSKPFGYDSL
jgi:hypothetical protein